MHPGSLSMQYNVCGSKNCKCKDKENPQKHGPYYQLSFTIRGKSVTRFIREEVVEDCKQHLANYKIFKDLTTEWRHLAAEHAKLKFELIKEGKLIKY